MIEELLLWLWLFLRVSGFVQSGKGRSLPGPPHNTLHAGPHRAFHLEW